MGPCLPPSSPSKWDPRYESGPSWTTPTLSLERLKVIVTEKEKTTTGLLQQVTQMWEDMKVLQEDVELMVEMTVNDIREVLLEHASNSSDNSPTPFSCRPPKKKRRSG